MCQLFQIAEIIGKIGGKRKFGTTFAPKNPFIYLLKCQKSKFMSILLIEGQE